jgi:3-isopropylmalate dehydrogenase
MLLRYGLRESEAADAVEHAIGAALSAGLRTPDIARPGEAVVGTRELGERVARGVLHERDAVTPTRR